MRWIGGNNVAVCENEKQLFAVEIGMFEIDI